MSTSHREVHPNTIWSTFQHRNGCFSVFNKWLYLRDVGNFLGNIHVTFTNHPKKNPNPKMNTKIVPLTTPHPLHIAEVFLELFAIPDKTSAITNPPAMLGQGAMV